MTEAPVALASRAILGERPVWRYLTVWSSM